MEVFKVQGIHSNATVRPADGSIPCCRRRGTYEDHDETLFSFLLLFFCECVNVLLIVLYWINQSIQ